MEKIDLTGQDYRLSQEKEGRFTERINQQILDGLRSQTKYFLIFPQPQLQPQPQNRFLFTPVEAFHQSYCHHIASARLRLHIRL
jgi:hypothetical protein